MNGPQAVGLCLAALVAAWVISDAMKRGKDSGAAFLWGLGVFAILIVFLPLYLFVRSEENKNGIKTGGALGKPRQTTLCRYCGLYSEGDPAYCPHCSKQLKGAEEIHSSSR